MHVNDNKLHSQRSMSKIWTDPILDSGFIFWEEAGERDKF